MSQQSKEEDKGVYNSSPAGSSNSGNDNEATKNSEKASGQWQNYSISKLNSVEYVVTQTSLPCGCQKTWRTPEPANDDVTLSDDDYFCPHKKSSKQ